jgi:hypothetical protein
VGVDCELVEPFRVGEVQERLAPDSAGRRRGVVDQDIHPAKAIDSRINQPDQVDLFGKVGRHRGRLSAGCLDCGQWLADRARQRVVGLDRARRQHHVRAAPREIERGLLAHAAARAGDDHNFARKAKFTLPLRRAILCG